MPALLNPFRVAPITVGASLDYFANTGKTWPWYSHAVYPASFYDSGTSTTWIAWETFTVDSLRAVMVTKYNHGTGAWGANVLVATHTMTDDDHGVPAICRDSDGYLHVFYGGHDSTGNITHSASTSPDDHTAWQNATTDFAANFYAYPRPIMVGSVMYLFLRKDDNVSTRTLTVRKSTALSGGVITWGSEQFVLSWGSNSRAYTGNMILSGTDIHFGATFADYNDTVRRDLYYFIYKTATTALTDVAGGNTVTTANLPADLTESLPMKVVDQTTNETNVPSIGFDTNSDPHMVYLDGTGTSYDVKHVMYTGGAWTSPATVASLTNQSRFTAVAVSQLPSAEMSGWYSTDGGNAYARGGDMVRKVRSSGGVWGSPSTIIAAGGTYGLDEPCPVRSAHANLRVIFCEVAGTSDDADGGAMKMYAYGDGGLLQRPTNAPSDIVLSSITIYGSASAGTVIGQLTAVDADPGDTVTWSITSDPDNKFAISGRELQLNHTTSHPNTHNVTIMATDSYGLTRTEVFAITTTASVQAQTDTFLTSNKLLVDGTRPGTGTDASIASVKLLRDGSA